MRNGSNSKEIKNSIANIQKRMSENLSNLQTWKTTHTKTRRQEEAISVFTNVKLSHNTLHEENTQYFDHITKENPSSTDTPIPKETWKAKALSNLNELSNLRALVTI